MRLYVTPASPWVRRVRVSILELGIQDRFEFVQTRWSHKWATQAVAHRSRLSRRDPCCADSGACHAGLHADDSHSICDYVNGELGAFRLLAREGVARWRALADIAIACGIIEAQVARRAELLRSASERSNDFIGKMRDRQLRCYGALEKRVTDFGATFDLAQITIAVACGYEDWRYEADGWRGVAPKLAAWFDVALQRPSMRATQPAETPQA